MCKLTSTEGVGVGNWRLKDLLYDMIRKRSSIARWRSLNENFIFYASFDDFGACR